MSVPVLSTKNKADIFPETLRCRLQERPNSRFRENYAQCTKESGY